MLRLLNHRLRTIEAKIEKTEGPIKIGAINSTGSPVDMSFRDSANGKSIVVVDYQYVVKYGIEGETDKQLANVKIEGELLFEADNEESADMKKKWESKKPIKDEHFLLILQSLLNMAQVEAILIAKQMSLPIPVQLSKVEKSE